MLLTTTTKIGNLTPKLKIISNIINFRGLSPINITTLKISASNLFTLLFKESTIKTNLNIYLTKASSKQTIRTVVRTTTNVVMDEAWTNVEVSMKEVVAKIAHEVDTRVVNKDPTNRIKTNTMTTIRVKVYHILGNNVCLFLFLCQPRR